MDKVEKMFIIKWRNKYSGETVYVEKINKKWGYFENTFDKKSAGLFKNKSAASRALNWLISSDEGKNNTFEVVPVSI